MEPTSMVWGAAGAALWALFERYGIRTLAEPRVRRALGQAETDEEVHRVLALAQTEQPAALIRGQQATYLIDQRRFLLTPPEPLDLPLNAAGLAMQNVVNAAVWKEVNVANSLMCTEELLTDTTGPALGAAVSEEFVHGWTEGAGATSDERMQQLWARLLAGEIKQPGRYSKRLQGFLRTLSPLEAEKIADLLSLEISGGICFEGDVQKFVIAAGFDMTALLEMEEIGIVIGAQSVLTKHIKSGATERHESTLTIGKRGIAVSADDLGMVLTLRQIKLSRLAMELKSLGHFGSNDQYVHMVAALIKDKCPKATVKIGDVVRDDGYQVVAIANLAEFSRSAGEVT